MPIPTPRPWLSLARLGVLASALVLTACGGGDAPPMDSGRARYDADKAHCDSISDIEAARKSCMTYRGWPDGKYKR